MYKIISLKTVDSTNNFANQFVKDNKSENVCGTVVFSTHQQQGKGTGQNIWESEKDKNILASIILCPHFLSPEKQFLISKTVSLGILKYFKNKNIDAKIKWPNDIFINNRKIAGVLIENSILGSNISTSIIGIGLNINQQKFIFSSTKPISLTNITNKNYSLIEELKVLLENIFIEYNKLSNKQFDEIDKEYFNNLYKKDVFTEYQTSTDKFYAKIHSIDEIGRLVLITKQNEIRKFSFKEVSIVL